MPPDPDAVLERLTALCPRRIDLSLDRILAFLGRIGSPHLHLPPVIHVAGTNGKGSVLAFLKAMLEGAGQSVHRYTSPHLARFNERIVLNGQEITDAELQEILEICEKAAQDVPLTFFEVITAAAFLAFSRHAADALLLEVGLGGRLDATNVVDNPAITIITSIDLDHQEFLGETLEQIAGEKAGIIKPGVPCITAGQPDEVRAVLEREASAQNAPLFVQGQDFTTYEEQGRLIYQDEGGLLDLPLPNLIGRHQIDNAALAIAALHHWPYAPITDDAIAQGLKTAVWPARMQRLKSGPLVDTVMAATGSSDKGEVWLDGGHNASGSHAAAQALADLDQRHARPIYMIFSMMNTKNPRTFLANFHGLVRHVVAVPIPETEACHAPETLCEAAKAEQLTATRANDVNEAIRQCLQMAREDGEPAPRIFICGSLYTAGEILKTHK